MALLMKLATFFDYLHNTLSVIKFILWTLYSSVKQIITIYFSYFAIFKDIKKESAKIGRIPFSFVICFHNYWHFYSFHCKWWSSPVVCILAKPFCLNASYSTMLTELDRFRERAPAIIGIRMQDSQFWRRIASSIPLVSLPKTRKSSGENFASLWQRGALVEQYQNLCPWYIPRTSAKQSWYVIFTRCQ